ncbi:MAG: RNA-binding S4 domain-containing protein [Parvibaculaceae bacterium]|jgi:ribosome-associated heat shock protein Hsp15
MAGERQRIDKWLWHARIVRTRTRAVEIVEAGSVRINKVKVLKPAHAVGIGDVITVAVHGHVHVLRVKGAAERRGPASHAMLLYESMDGAAQNLLQDL